ncbi:uncharacterized protein LOC127126182 [Lathyrus oleraceus]|uniref:uncharacterized protein LOC127126182 n=1 Tax=Pisum sativum TaxID=3888 RepID=UPI0021CF4140|nr:uncharacterized protein LOC127126182 [Pisum sativum]
MTREKQWWWKRLWRIEGEVSRREVLEEIGEREEDSRAKNRRESEWLAGFELMSSVVRFTLDAVFFAAFTSRVACASYSGLEYCAVCRVLHLQLVVAAGFAAEFGSGSWIVAFFLLVFVAALCSLLNGLAAFTC